jgi:hypothetical protein
VSTVVFNEFKEALILAEALSTDACIQASQPALAPGTANMKNKGKALIIFFI